jgi:MFS family permease
MLLHIFLLAVMVFILMIDAGAAVGPLLAGVVSIVGWQYVFYMLMIANVLALLVRHHSLLLPFNLYALNHSDARLPELECTATILSSGIVCHVILLRQQPQS